MHRRPICKPEESTARGGYLAARLPDAVRSHHLVVDAGLLREGLQIGLRFGFRSLEEMARIALFLEAAVYEAHSLQEIPGGVQFALRNPPLRMGAFSGFALRWDDAPVAPEACSVRPAASDSPVRFSDVGRSNPVVLPVGERVEFSALVGPPSPGPHTARLELRSLAIPPIVWFRVTDHVRPRDGSLP
jgi:hypothetical protein